MTGLQPACSLCVVSRPETAAMHRLQVQAQTLVRAAALTTMWASLRVPPPSPRHTCRCRLTGQVDQPCSPTPRRPHGGTSSSSSLDGLDPLGPCLCNTLTRACTAARRIRRCLTAISSCSSRRRNSSMPQHHHPCSHHGSQATGSRPKCIRCGSGLLTLHHLPLPAQPRQPHRRRLCRLLGRTPFARCSVLHPHCRRSRRPSPRLSLGRRRRRQRRLIGCSTHRRQRCIHRRARRLPAAASRCCSERRAASSRCGPSARLAHLQEALRLPPLLLLALAPTLALPAAAPQLAGGSERRRLQRSGAL